MSSRHGSFKGHDSYNHSEHYFHSSFNDLVITGLVGLRPRDDDVLEVKPLAPADWDYFALDAIPCQGRLISIIWDRDGERYRRGKGLRLFADGHAIAASEKLAPLAAKLPKANVAHQPKTTPVNYAVNNDGAYVPRVSTSYSDPRTPLAKLIDGNYWYHRDPPNRWTCAGSPNASDSIVVDFGTDRTVHSVKLFFLDNETGIIPPEKYDLEFWNRDRWATIPSQSRIPESPTGRRANLVSFPAIKVARIRVVLHHEADGKTGLTELEVWGDAILPVAPSPHPAGNLAYNPGDREFPKASALFSDRYGGRPEMAIDGRTNFLPSPMNRWTSYESPHETDWLEVDFGAEKEFSRVELAIYDDRGGVQPPAKYEIEFWDGEDWLPVTGAVKTPALPTGSQINEVRFDRAETSKMRIVFTHDGKARSGVSEILVWNDGAD